jgi:hypothetical protein
VAQYGAFPLRGIGKTNRILLASSKLIRALTPWVMSEKTYMLRFKTPELSMRAVIASTAEIHGEHLVLLNSQGQLAALFVLEMIESWNEVPG